MLKNIFNLSIQLASLQRYSLTKLVNPESVLEHQGAVALMGVVLGLRLNGAGENFNIGNIAYLSTIHDIDEIGTGDIPRPTKYSSDEVLEALENLAEKSVEELDVKLGIALVDIWKMSKEGHDGAVVSLCDGLSVLCKVWQETAMFGNKVIVNHAGPVRKMLDKKFNNMIGFCETAEGINMIALLRNQSFDLCDEVESHRYNEGENGN